MMENTISEKSAEVLGVLEQIESVNKMIELHRDDRFMREQYEYRKEELSVQLIEKLKAYQVNVENKAA